MSRSADQLADLPLGELLDQLAAATPAPGGGSATALACSLAAGLVEMAAGFASEPEPTARRAATLRRRALELAQSELHSYGPVLDALRLAPDHPEREERLRTARSEASLAPLAIAELGAELAELAARTAGSGSPHLAGDAIAAALLAEGACRAAAELVAINLGGAAPGDLRARQAGELAGAAANARARALDLSV